MKKWFEGRGLGTAGIALAALVLAIGGGSAHALKGKNTVDSGDIIKNAVKSADVKNGGVKAADLAAGSVDGAKIKDAGVTAADLASGSVDANAVKDESLGGADVADNSLGGADVDESTLGGPLVRGVTQVTNTSADGVGTRQAFATCPAGTVAIGGGGRVTGDGGGKDYAVTVDMPLSIDGPEALPRQWFTQADDIGPGDNDDYSVTATALCAKVN